MKDKVERAKERIREVLQGYGKVGIAFSGGKDSTALLLLTLEVIKELNSSSKLFLIHADTLVENPLIREHCDLFLEELSTYAKREGLDIEVCITRPKETYWINLIGKGYPLPNYHFRWCQKYLKIKPLEELQSGLGIDVMLSAVRENESKSRKASMNKNYEGIKKKAGFLTIAPIREWTEEDVWQFLTGYSCSWTDLGRVYRVYKDAAGECPLLSNGTVTACGARFGCWVCTVVREDRSLKNLVQVQSNERLKPFYEFRNFLMDFCQKPENRTGYTRRGRYIGEGKGQLTLSARREILRRLLELEKRLGKVLLQEGEKERIKALWREEGDG